MAPPFTGQLTEGSQIRQGPRDQVVGDFDPIISKPLIWNNIQLRLDFTPWPKIRHDNG